MTAKRRFHSKSPVWPLLRTGGSPAPSRLFRRAWPSGGGTANAAVDARGGGASDTADHELRIDDVLMGRLAEGWNGVCQISAPMPVYA